MPYTLQLGKSDTLAATLNSGATSTTLTTGNFGSPTGQQYYVVDYDVPAKAEIILATVVTTAVTSITRGLTGGAASTTDHAIGAKIGAIFVPQHYASNITHTVSTAVQTGTTLIPIDDTIPQITEGNEYLTASITPTSATNKLIIEVVLNVAHTAANHISAALFQDSTANALASGIKFNPTANTHGQIVLRHEMTSGTTSATTFRVRAGADVAGTTTINGVSGARVHGGVLASTLRVTEIKS